MFFIQDAIKFPDLIHAVKMEPDRGFPQAASAHDTFWDFISLMPEVHAHDHVGHVGSRHSALAAHDGRLRVHTLPAGQRGGESTFVKFHWRPSWLQSTVWDEAVKIAVRIPTFTVAICSRPSMRGDFPEWEFGVQVFTQKQADASTSIIWMPTKVIPKKWCR